MALQIETIRATADRVAASHQLDIVDLEFTGGVKHRALRVFLEKNAEARARFAKAAADAAAKLEAVDHIEVAADSDAEPSGLPQGVPVERLSFVTHEDCVSFAQDFSTVLDVEDLIPGAEYTLEVSSPGLERKLFKAADYERFQGSLVKLQTFSPVDSNRQFTGRLTGFDGTNLTLDLAGVKQKGKAKKAMSDQTVTLALGNIEKANLVAEI